MISKLVTNMLPTKSYKSKNCVVKTSKVVFLTANALKLITGSLTNFIQIVNTLTPDTPQHNDKL